MSEKPGAMGAAGALGCSGSRDVTTGRTAKERAFLIAVAARKSKKGVRKQEDSFVAVFAFALPNPKSVKDLSCAMFWTVRRVFSGDGLSEASPKRVDSCFQTARSYTVECGL